MTVSLKLKLEVPKYKIRTLKKYKRTSRSDDEIPRSIMLLFLYILQSKENQRVTLLRGTLIPGDDRLDSVGKVKN